MANLNIKLEDGPFTGKLLDLTKQVVIKALQDFKAFSPSDAKKSDELYSKVKSLYPSIDQYITFDTFKTYTSQLSRKNDSPIAKEVGQHGYFLKEKEEVALSIETEEFVEEKNIVVEGESKDISKIKRIENLLYPILLNWLSSQGYRVKDTSSMRDRILGTWGNPDVTGIKAIENIGNTELEIVTIEAKSSLVGFEKNIFEAVSHRRFANRSYFAFAAPNSFLIKNNEDLRYYSELFQIGIIVIAMEEKTYNSYCDGEIQQLNTDEVDVYEVFSTRYEYKQNRWQKDFCQALGIIDNQSLYEWGTSSSD